MSGQPLGTGEGESPLAKPTVPNMDVRTMASDMQSINTGSPAPKPYAPVAPSSGNIPSFSAPTPPPPAPEQSFQIPQTDSSATPTSPETPVKKSNRGLFTVIIIVIAVIALAALGYFVIYPIFFAAPVTPTPTVTNPEPTPPVTEPVPTPTPEPTPTPATTTTPAAVTAPAHISLFTIPADNQLETSIVTTGATLASLVISTTATPAISEITYKDATGNLMKFSDVLRSAAGLDIAANQTLLTAFNDLTATGLVYIDSANAKWLGFAAQLTSGADTASVSAAFKQVLESATNYSGLFASAPGTAQTWKDGQISGVTGNRYLLFSNSGFALDYGWVGNKLVIMTSYNGFKEAARRLQ